jgi:hypothetical protein
VNTLPYYTARQGYACALVTRPYADENPRIRVDGESEARIACAQRIAAMLNGEEDPEIVRLRQIIEATHNILFDAHDASDIEHMIECHAEGLPAVARKIARINREAMALVSPVVSDLVGG